MESGVYVIKIGGKIKYIGASKDLSTREGIHRRELKRGVHENPYLQEAYNKNKTFEFEILERCPNYYEREAFWVQKIGIENLANEATPDGRGGNSPSERMNKKRSIAAKKYFQTHEANKGMFGKKHTEESKAKMRANHSPNSPRFQKGHVVSQETREKISRKLKEKWDERKSRV